MASDAVTEISSNSEVPFWKRYFLQISVSAIIFLWICNLVLPLPCIGECPAFLVLKEKGIFGDKFGAVNSLFTGISIVGIVWAIIQQEEQISIARNDLKTTQEILQITRDDANKTKEILDNQISSLAVQNKISTDQNFSTLFFNAVTMLKGIESAITSMNGNKIIQGRDAFDHDVSPAVWSILLDEDINNEKIIAKLNPSRNKYGELINQYVIFSTSFINSTSFNRSYRNIFTSLLSVEQKVYICLLAKTGIETYQSAASDLNILEDIEFNKQIEKKIYSIFPREFWDSTSDSSRGSAPQHE